MSAFHYAIYAGLGLVLVALGLWRGSRGARLKPFGTAIGATILVVIALSFLGVVSLDGVESCLNEKGVGRSKLFRCLAYVHMAGK
jgi:hypothetical protein